MAVYELHNPGEQESRVHGETPHEKRILDLNSAPEAEIARLRMIGPKSATHEVVST